MMGASAWGYLDFNLGLFYGDMGVLAGFDVCVRNMGNTPCMNIPRTPGYKGWYAEGQLYAYIYAKFGIHVNLGFWDKKFDIIDAGIGGVFRMGLPNPTYFTGEARVKLSLLAGLVKINRKFEFECGDRCDIFYGNALDNFKLFGECSMGDTIQANGWKKENAINPKFFITPYINTEAPIKEHFRVLDETELNRLAQDFNGDKERLKAQASRTFVFDMNTTVLLYEYSKATQNLKNYDRCIGFKIKGTSRFNHQINMTELNPNKFYRMMFVGWAKEIENGQEVDPLKWNEAKKKYENVEWMQTKEYFFCTGPKQELDDNPEDLQQYVAIAYPSNYNQLKHDKYIPAYCADIKAPNIAFLSDISGKTFKKGKLRWKLERYMDRNRGWQLVEEKDAYWVVTDSTCNMTVKGGEFDAKVYNNSDYRLQLNYVVSRSETKVTFVWDPRQQKSVRRASTVIVADTTNIVRLLLESKDGYYHCGYDKGKQVDYEKPFVGIRLNSVTMKTSAWRGNACGLSYYKKYMTDEGVNPMRYQDPYTYITYMSNYGLVGGWNLTNKRLAVNATTAQSLIYYDRGGVYEGAYKTSYGSMADYGKVKAMSIYDQSQWNNDCQFPLPQMTDAKYNYAFGGRERAYKLFTSGKDDDSRAINLILDLYAVYSAVDEFDSKFRCELQQILSYGKGEFYSSAANAVEQLMNANAGVYITATSRLNSNVRIEVPYYQLGILWGSPFNNAATRGKTTMWSSFDNIPKDYTRPQEERSEDILLGLVGNNRHNIVEINYNQVITGVDKNGRYTKGTRGPYLDFIPRWNNITKINVTSFRVNAYNFKKAEYTVSNRAYLNMGPRWSRYVYTINNPSRLFTCKNVNNWFYNNY